MNRFTLSGLLACLIASVMVGFQGLSQLMEKESNWGRINLVDLIGDARLRWAMGYDWLVTVLHTPLFLLLFILGGVLILLGMVFWRR